MVAPPMNRAILLLLGLLLLFCGTSCTRKYFAKVTFEYRVPGGPTDPAAEREIREKLPRFDRTIVVNSVRNTGLFEIGVYDRDPHYAAKRANDLMVKLRTDLHDPA